MSARNTLRARSIAVRPPEKKLSHAPVRTLVISVGNSSLFGGVFSDAKLTKSFRVPTSALFRIARYAPAHVDRVVICSVVPPLTPDVQRFVRRTWQVEPQLLTFDAPHGLQLGYRQPRQLGVDRIAAALGARVAFPKQNVLIVDCGTASTITALRRDAVLLGGAILPGLAMGPEILALRTAQLPRVTVTRPRSALGRSTTDAIASGVFFGHVGALREVISRLRAEAFQGKCVVVGTGGHAARFAREKLFTTIQPELILRGLHEFADREIRS